MLKKSGFGGAELVEAVGLREWGSGAWLGVAEIVRTRVFQTVERDCDATESQCGVDQVNNVRSRCGRLRG